MKRAFKYFAAMLAAAILCLALVACGEKAGTKYTFKETKVTTDSTVENPSLPSLESIYNTTYKDSTLEVKDGEIIWTIGGIASSMTATKDGDRYVLGGDFTKQLSQALGEGGSITYYGQKTEEGYAIVMVEAFADNTIMSNITLTLYFTAA